MQVQVDATPVVNDLSSWERQRTTLELQSFIDRRSKALGEELDDIDFELASI